MLSRTHVGKTTLEVAAPVIERWHYSHRVPTGKNLFYVWRLDGNGLTLPFASDMFGSVIYAVANYGIGVNPFQAAFVARQYNKSLSNDQLVELKRLARVEPKLDGLPLTYFLARCHKLLARSGYRCVVSFSDPAQKHTGGIYKAANFDHCGQSSEEFHLLDAEGNVRHRRYAYRYARRNGVSIDEAREELGVQRVATPPKDRWVLWL